MTTPAGSPLTAPSTKNGSTNTVPAMSSNGSAAPTASLNSAVVEVDPGSQVLHSQLELSTISGSQPGPTQPTVVPHEGGSRDETLDEDEDEEEDEDDGDEEPSLKYERMMGNVPEILDKDSASCFAASSKIIVIATHNGMVHALDLEGSRVKSYRAHSASVVDIQLDSHDEWIATASMDGQAVVHSIHGNETHGSNLKRPLKTISLEPGFSKSGSKAFVTGGLAGVLTLHERGWLGNKETILHTSDSPIWAARWNSELIAWADDSGARIYNHTTQEMLPPIARPAGSPRAELYKCTLRWQDDTTLLIAWADHIMIARIRTRANRAGPVGVINSSTMLVEVTAHFQVDSMISGIVPYANPLGSLLSLDFIPSEENLDEETTDRAEQKRKAANRPELRIISRSGEELSSDALTVRNFHLHGCNDYWLDVVHEGAKEGAAFYIVVSPKDVIIVRSRDASDHVSWLVERERYEEALEAVDRMGPSAAVSASEIGRKYVEHLIEEGQFERAAKLATKIFGQNAKDWEDSVFIFAKHKHLQAIIPFVPTRDPQLSRLVYEMVIAHFLQNDKEALLRTIKEWPSDVYDISAVIVAVKAELDRGRSSRTLMECMAELYTRNRQPGKALEYYLRLRRPDVFEFIRENNLFVVVRDQILLLMDFDQELKKPSATQTQDTPKVQSEQNPSNLKSHSKAVSLLVDHTHSIPVGRVVQQLQGRPYYIYLYLDALFEKEPYLAADFADTQVELYAEYEPCRLMDFLRASNYYDLEKAYKICLGKDFVPEMVFLLGRIGDNAKALSLIIERLNDVNRAIDFAKEQNDDDLWEALLDHSESRPAFIRGLLENVGAEIDPIRLIRRIRNGLEIPGLKDAVIKILWEFNLQVSLLGGCQTILNSDGITLVNRLQARQTSGTLSAGSRLCPICDLPLFDTASVSAVATSVQSGIQLILFLCRHLVHAACIKGGDTLPPRASDDLLSGFYVDSRASLDVINNIGSKIAYASVVRSQLEEGCPVCSSSGSKAHGR